MSIEGGKQIRCDGAGCSATAAVPVALHPRLAAGGQDVRPTDGWLYVVSNGKEQHFCPMCTHQRLKTLSGLGRSTTGTSPRREW